MALGATWSIGKGGWFLLIAGGLWIIVSETNWRFFNEPAVGPYPWMLAAPLLLLQYASVTDFRIRLVCFFMLLYILVWAQGRKKGHIRISLGQWPAWRVWLLSFVTFALAAAVIHARGVHLSGDEPHYIMIAQSLAEDGDFNLENNLRDRTYRSFMPVKIAFHGTVWNGKYHSFHLPGVSFLLVPFFFLFNFLGGAIPASLFFRLCAALINAFFALGLFHVLKKTLPDEDHSIFFVFFLATFPLLFHAVHLYPELPAATLLIFSFLCSRGQQHKSSDPAGGESDLSVPKGNKYFLAGLLLAGIPWFHFKYVLPALVLVVFVTVDIWRNEAHRKNKIRDLALFLLPAAVSVALLSLYSKMLYGSFNPLMISPERSVFAIPLRVRMETLLSFFLDQRDGLLVYAPVFLMLFLVFKKETREKIGDFSLLAAIFFSYILFHAYTTVRGAYSPAARPTLHIIWVMAVFLIAVYRQAGEWGKTLFRFLAGLTCLATVWLLYYPFFLYQPVTRDVSQRASSLLLFLGSAAVDLGSLFPSFLKTANADYLPNWIWLFSLTGVAVLYYARASFPWPKKVARFFIPGVTVMLLMLLCYFPHVQLGSRYRIGNLSFFNSSRNFLYWSESKSFQILAGKNYDLFFEPGDSSAERLELSLRNPNRIALCVRNGRRILLAENRAENSRVSISLGELQSFALGKKKLLHIGLEAGAVPGTAFFWLEFR